MILLPEGMFKDKAFQVKSAVDKRGRKIRKDRSKEDMRKYYRIQQEEVCAILICQTGSTAMNDVCP